MGGLILFKLVTEISAEDHIRSPDIVGRDVANHWWIKSYRCAKRKRWGAEEVGRMKPMVSLVKRKAR